MAGHHEPPHRQRIEWKLTELAAEARVSARTVRYYVQRGLLPPPTFRGPDTAYGTTHLQRLLLIQRLQAAYLPLDLIQRRLAEMSPAELEAAAGGGPLSVEEAPAAPPTAAPMTPRALPSSAVATPAMVAPEGEPEAAATSTWERWPLAPGLELHLDERAGAEVRALAQRLRAAAERATDTDERGELT